MLIDQTSPRRPRRKLRIALKLLGCLVVLALIGGTGFMFYMKHKYANFQMPQTTPGVVVAKAVDMNFSDRLEAIGTATAVESATITATVTETVKSINVAEGQSVKAGTVIVELNDDEEAATLEEASKSYDRYNKLAQSKIGSEARKDQERARMDVARAQLAERRLVAPFDGVLGIRQVSVGDLVTPGTVITTIDSIDPIQMSFSVPEEYLAVLKPGLTIQARTDAYPGKVFEGTISAIDSRVNSDTRAIMVKAQIPNADFTLRPGLLMKTTIVKSSRMGLAIPEEAIQSAGTQKSVLVVGPDNKVQSVNVETGIRQIGYVEVTSGLKAGDKVMIEGQIKTQPGMEVKIESEKTIPDAVKTDLDFSVERKQEALEGMTAASDAAPAPQAEPSVADQPVTAPAQPAVKEDTKQE